jgi:hypothetical protein
MSPGCGRDAAIERALAALARVDASPTLTDGVRRRIHEHVTRTTHRSVWWGSRLSPPHRWAAEAALAAAALLLYVAVVVRQALGFFDH